MLWIEERGALETARRALQYCGRIFRYAIATSRAERDPTADLRGALPPVKVKKHFAAVMEPDRVGELLRAMDGYQGTFPVICALRLAPLVFVRPGELRKTEWRYTVTKTDTQHIVPLSWQAVAILRELQPLTGGRRYVFPSARTAHRPMSDNAVLSAFRRMGIPKEDNEWAWIPGHGANDPG
uniref:Phage integrase family n=1 Tax=Candidatus Kentrum eta TaxID=2126337 RepID=A0A450VFA3_9GAMM|nr:MAG: Phage integrase family [Candidatus Kentron sp. H]VFK03428.1 MAG: Phage integrase family [Candidatus Kentron sp. H]VFK05016.1 MAG: Phage integrase family [Candidatus Kentron sp. H]